MCRELTSIFDGVVSVREILVYLDTDRYLTKGETAQYLGKISLRKLEGLALPSYRVGARRFYRKSEIDVWMARRRESSEDIDQLVEECLKGVV